MADEFLIALVRTLTRWLVWRRIIVEVVVTFL